jgi:hypothetical protein
LLPNAHFAQSERRASSFHQLAGRFNAAGGKPAFRLD